MSVFNLIVLLETNIVVSIILLVSFFVAVCLLQIVELLRLTVLIIYLCVT